ncbi:MAG: DUF2442 domain-containing protein [Planctomycetota bacterium]|jgi:hypothetical protein
MLEVVEAEHVDGFRIRLRFSNGEAGVVDLESAMWGPAFESLRDPTNFRSFRVSDVFHTVCWDNGADLAPEFLYARMVEQARASGDAAPTR